MTGKQTVLAVAASKFWKVNHSKLKTSPARKYSWPRQVCQWIACDAGISKIDVAKFWGVNKSTIYSSFDKVDINLKLNSHAEKEIKEFGEFAKTFFRYGTATRFPATTATRLTT
jgi:hypothetical protein